MPFQQEVNRPNGKDIIKDYTSEDGNTKYHAEFHYNTGTHAKLQKIEFMSQWQTDHIQWIISYGPYDMVDLYCFRIILYVLESRKNAIFI